MNVGFKHGALRLVSDKTIPVGLHVSCPLVVPKLEVLGAIGRKLRLSLLVSPGYDIKQQILERKPPVVSVRSRGTMFSVIHCCFWF